MKKIYPILLSALLMTVPVCAQTMPEDEGMEPITQKEFACELVRTMNIQGWLPLAAVNQDCINLLERMGISPLSGWTPNELLKQEDYLVILTKTNGKEAMLHERALAVERKNREVIDQKWKESFDKKKKWISLNELLNDKTYFPEGAPLSPYGRTYRDRNNDHKVDKMFFLPAELVKIRNKLSFK